MAIPLPKVGIVVLNYNGRDYLPHCLRSLFTLRYPNYFVVVVDNASVDDSLVAAEEQFPECSFVRSSENRGFAAGMNEGMRAAWEQGATWVWLFNNDALAEPDSLTVLMAAAVENKRAGLLSPCIYTEKNGKLWFGKGYIDFFRMRVTHVAPSEQELRQSSFPSEFLTGCALLVNRQLTQSIGLLDERFFLYYEDADFSLRAREAGFVTVVVPAARVFHEEQSQKNGEKLYYLVLSGLLFFAKHATWWQRGYFLLYGTIRRLKNGIDVRRGRAGALMVHRAYHDFYHDR